jgi:hypothetical protein
MKNMSANSIIFIFSTAFFLLSHSCNNNTSSKKQDVKESNPVAAIHTFTKPHSTYPDTLIITSPAAVFYHPDSLQLLKIKAVTDSNIYKSSMHEYYYQMLTARILLKRNWPGLKIVESNKNRFLLFIKKDNSRIYIDLDTKKDTHGLFVFDGKKAPILVDMTNLETIVSYYLKE